jgi:hypothetical protein
MTMFPSGPIAGVEYTCPAVTTVHLREPELVNAYREWSLAMLPMKIDPSDPMAGDETSKLAEDNETCHTANPFGLMEYREPPVVPTQMLPSAAIAGEDLTCANM